MRTRNHFNKVFYAERYHPIQAGSIDGTDTVPHDNAVSRALLCSSASLYDPFGDPKIIGDPYCTLFVGRLSHFTTEQSLLKAMNKYGRVKNLRLVRNIVPMSENCKISVTGASRGYAFVEYETDREMRRAYMDAHHSIIDDHEITVDYCRQLLMPGWIPRRLGGGVGGRKESGQLRFGGRDRPFRAPLQQIPYDTLKSLGIPLPAEGNYLSRSQVPSPPRRKSGSDMDEVGLSYRYTNFDNEEKSRRSSSIDLNCNRSPKHKEKNSGKSYNPDRERSVSRGDHERRIHTRNEERPSSRKHRHHRSEHYEEERFNGKDVGNEDEERPTSRKHRHHRSEHYREERFSGKNVGNEDEVHHKRHASIKSEEKEKAHVKSYDMDRWRSSERDDDGYYEKAYAGKEERYSKRRYMDEYRDEDSSKRTRRSGESTCRKP